MKKIAVINDLSGLGKCSLTAAIPVISVMGVQACPLPTAILSAQTGFPSYYYDDYTSHMEGIMLEWKKMDFCPDGIYTGFLAGAEQADKVLEFLDLFGGSDVKLLTDPVMGDVGEEYPIYSEELCEKMRILASRADVITPNLTEALLLLYGREEAHKRWENLKQLSKEIYIEEVQKLGRKLSKRFRTEAVITGVDLYEESGRAYMANLIAKGEKCAWIKAEKEGGSYSGTGDLCASVLAAGMVQGYSTEESMKKAVRFIAKAIRDTVAEGTDRNEGVCFERHLGELLQR